MSNKEIENEILTKHNKLTRQALANELGLTIGQVKGRIERLGLMGDKPGAKKKPFMEQKVTFSTTIKRKHFADFERKVKEIILNYN